MDNQKRYLWKPYREIIKAKWEKRRANLSDANLYEANLSGANLYEANLSGANLYEANLSYADLSGANLSYADLSDAKLLGANLSYADLSDAKLLGANLSDAKLLGANLLYAKLSGANLSGANLSGSKGLLDPLEWMKQNFKQTSKGFIVYKAFGETYNKPPSSWRIEPDSIIEEVVNSNRSNECGCGVNFATKEWIKREFINKSITIWKCLLRLEDMVNLVVPYNTDGKARCSRLELLKVVSKGE